MPATTAPTEIAAAGVPAFPLEPAQAILIGLLGLEIAVFAVIGTNFFSVGNAFEVLRLSVEIGLLAIALTPVITTGGIDLSVGSLMGLSAVVFGKLWRDGGLSIGAAAAATLCLGALAGSLNGLLVTRGRIPPLIVTLGSFSMFRGLAEGLTGGVDNFTHFPERFLLLGEGHPDTDFRDCRRGVLDLAPPYHDRPRTGRNRLLIGRSALCRPARRTAGRAGLRAFGTGRQPGGRHLCRSPRSSQGRRRHRL